MIRYQGDLIEATLANEPVGRPGAPGLLFINYKAPDYTGHVYGMFDPMTGDALRDVDEQLGRLVAQLDDLYPGRYALIVTADHGQCPLPDAAGGVRLDPIQLWDDIEREFGGGLFALVQNVVPSEVYLHVGRAVGRRARRARTWPRSSATTRTGGTSGRTCPGTRSSRTCSTGSSSPRCSRPRSSTRSRTATSRPTSDPASIPKPIPTGSRPRSRRPPAREASPRLAAMRACPNCGTENPDEARFCMSCAAPLSPPELGREIRKTVTVVFCDVTGSTALGERLDPETLRRVMTRYFDAMKVAVEHHGGTVEKFIGDAVMAVFGIPQVHEDDALRAVRAAIEMRDGLEDLNKELERDRGVTLAARIGVNTGEVVTGDPTGQTLVTGDAVNTAARLEQAAAPGEVLIGAETYRLTRDAVRAEPADPVAAKGKAEPIRAYRLEDVTAGVAGHTRRLDAPMVGRDRELALLRTSVRAGHDGSRLSSLHGPGSGRRGEDETGGGVRRPGRRGRDRASWPVPGLRRRHHVLAGRRAGGPGGGALDPRPAGGGAEEAAHRDRAGRTIGADRRPRRGHRRSLRDRGTRRGIVLGPSAIPGDPRRPSTAARCSSTISNGPSRRSSISWSTSRSGPATPRSWSSRRRGPSSVTTGPGWGGGVSNATSILLEPLTDAETVELVADLIGDTEVAGDVSARVSEAAEGNPLFVEEMVAMLIDDGYLVREDDRWVAAGDLSEVKVPPTVQALIAARLDRLAPLERAVLERAAIIGKVFAAASIRSLASEELSGKVDEGIRALLRKDLIRPDRGDLGEEDSYRFRHLLVRDAVYDAMPKELRADLHEAFADWLEREARSAGELDEFVGYHLEQSYRYREELGPIDDAGSAIAARAGTHLLAAGERALGRGDVAAAERLLGRAMALLPADDPGPCRPCRPWARRCTTAVSSSERSSSSTRRPAEPPTQAPRRSAPASRSIAPWSERTSNRSSRCDPRLTEIESHMAALEAAGDDLGLAEGWSTIGVFRFWLGDGAGGLEAIDRARGHAERAGSARLIRLTSNELLGPFVWGPVPSDEVIERASALIAEMEAAGSDSFELTQSLAVAHAMRGEIDLADGHFDRSLTRARELGERLHLAAAHPQLEAGLILGRYAETERLATGRDREAPCHGRARIPRDLVDLPGRGDRVTGSARRGRDDPEGGRGARG